MSDSIACNRDIIVYYKWSNWVHTTNTPCCFLNLPVETARALQMSTAVNVITALTHRLPNKEDKLSVLVPSRAGQIVFFFFLERVVIYLCAYLFIFYLFIKEALTAFHTFDNNSCLLIYLKKSQGLEPFLPPPCQCHRDSEMGSD